MTKPALPSNAAPAVEFAGVSKRFGAVLANDAVSFAIARGAIHGIVGENGAGKSTLMSILYGFYQPDSGAIRLDGEPVRIRTSHEAIARGIGMVHQHFMLVDAFTVLENIVLGIEGGALLGAGLDRARAKLAELGRDYGLEVDADARVGDLPVGVQQRVEILKTLYRGAEIMILDEPTAVLTLQEVEGLFATLQKLRNEGKTVIIVTHKLREIMALTDAVTIMRAGKVAAQRATAETSAAELAELMVGRKLDPPRRAPATPGPVVLEVRDLSLRDRRGVALLDGIDFTARRGEILGIAGVSGNGQTELLEVLAGLRAPSRGRIVFEGEDLAPHYGPDLPARLRRKGIAHVPEDRHGAGMVMPFSAQENAVLGYQGDRDLGPGPMLQPSRLLDRCRRFMAKFDVRPADPALRASLFSGGNQQKLVLAREIDRDPELLLIGQPTRGVDIGAIEFIHGQLLALRAAGKALIVVSTELEEILALADRILVMCAGRITGELAAGEADEARIGLMMAGMAA
ncbi:MAG: ABC transporter ATP-binding protein [Aliidongia sp.]